METLINIQELTKYYGKSRGVSGLNLTIKENEIFGFIGPNGSGKSTTIRLMMGLIFPTSGYATIFGKDVVKYGPEIRKSIGYLPAEVFYYEKMKVKDLLNYSASFYKKDCKHKIYELSERMSLDLNKKIEDLSFGNKKKVGIVQSLIHEPKLLILDEPTSGLDPLMQKNFFALLKEESDKGTTIFLSSHILSEVQAICNRVAIIKDGKIIKQDDMKNLRENLYKKIYVKSQTLSEKIHQLTGISNYENHENESRFLYHGEIPPLLQVLASENPYDVLIEDPSLEEIFLHYYQL